MIVELLRSPPVPRSTTAVVHAPAATLPTFDRWRANADAHHDAVVELIGTSGRDAFVRSCDILEAFWRDGTFGYGLVSATRPGSLTS